MTALLRALVALLAFIVLHSPPITAEPIFNQVNKYTVDGELCPAVTKRNLECPPLCVRSLTDCPESASISCPTGEQLCGDGQCHASCGTVVNVCTCNGGSDLEIALVACPVFAPVDVANFNPSNKSAQITAQCSQEFDVNTVDYAMDWASFSTDYRGAWRNCPTDIPDPWYTYTEPMWVGTFAAAGAELLILLSWWLCRKMRQLYRAKASPTLFMAPRGKDDGSATSSDCDGDIKLVGKPEPTSRMSQASMSLESLDAVETPELEFNVQGYCNHWYGTMVLATLVPVSLGFVVFLAIITADYYGSLNDVAISLSYGSTRLSNHTLIMVWYSATVWFLTLNVTRFRLRNAFRMPCAHAQSHVVQIEQALEPMVMLDSESRSLRWLRRLEERVKRFAGWHVVVRTERVHRTQQDRLYFTYQCTRYVLNEATDRFEPFDLCLGDTSQKVLAHEKGLATSEAKRRLELIGPNFISVHVPNFFVALGQEFTSFFYLYQLLILWLFYYNMYYKIGLVDTGVVLLSAIVKVAVRLKAERDLKAMAEHVIDCTVLRDGEWTTLSSNDLVPGDVIRVEKGLAVPCDTLITTGSIIVDESSLTGEALPVRKSALDRTIDQPLTPSVLKNHLLFAGTQVSEVHMPGSLSGTNEKTVTTLLKATMAAEALVYRTSTTTDKGQLVRKILFPNPISFIFNEQLKMVIAILGLYGVFVFACGMWLMKSNLEAAWFYAMFALAQLISPILPAALVVGQSIASLRLRRKKIFCVDLPRIMIAGKVQLFCFDKTGTLTKEGLEFYGVQPIIDAASFSATAPVGHTQGPLVPQMLDEKQPYFAERQIDPLQLPTILQQGIASCHAVSNIDEQLIGNPVDIEMFRASGWTLHTPESEQYLDTVCPTEQSTNGQIHIVKRFNFDHARASMSVAVLDPTTNHVHIYVKGSFEKLRDLASASSIPSDYDHVTAQLARQGCYVLAMAHRDLGPVDPTTLHQWSRDQMEQGIALIGLVLFKNNLKPDTADAIAELKQGATRTVMITGDTALTGVFIARACGLAPPNDRMLLGDIDGKQGSVVWTDVDTDEVVDLHQVLLDARQSPEARDVELAVTGKAFNLLVMRDQIREYLLNIRVFARMTPQDKVDCVQLHMERGITAMCGDGGNDCGALRAAHVGLALSEAEASIVSPFSSSVRSIFSCVELLRQGRSALATSFAEYKYLILYGQTMAMLKFCTFYFSISISQGIWIFVDTFITVGLATAIAFSKPKRTLAWRRPTARLLGVQTLCSTIGLVAIDWLFLIFGFVMLYQQDWFRCHEFDALDVDISKWWLIADNYEAEVLALIMLFQFVNNAAVYNFGHVFRRSWWRNYPLVIIWAVFICIASYICLADPNWLGCSMRINCGTADTLVELGYPRPDFYIEPYNIDQGHNVMPKDFRYKLWGYTIGNMLAGVLWEKFVVIGPVQRLLERHFPLHRTKYKS